MELLRRIQTTDLLGIDIETAPIAETYYELSEDYKLAWQYKNRQDNITLPDEELAELWTRISPLYPEFGKICAISVALFSTDKEGNQILKCKEIWSETGNELEILATFGVFINKAYDHNGRYRLIGHAAKYFDYGYICKRFVINNLPLPRILDTAHLKPWETNNLCTNKDIWKMGFDGPGSSLIALCVALQIPITKGDIDGSQVGEAYYRGEYQRIGKYCSLDAIAVINIVRKIKHEPIFKFEDVKYY